MVDVIDCQIELVIMLFYFSAILGTTVSQNSQHWQALAGIERQHFVVEQVGRCNRHFHSVELAMHDLAVISN